MISLADLQRRIDAGDLTADAAIGRALRRECAYAAMKPRDRFVDFGKSIQIYLSETTQPDHGNADR